MSLEQFKTQVLLLHSEQSTLDNLSSGFNDRYTVHCATSGSEALNTLGEIQIDVIVSAQDLPGMSGLDALREAKKRSPETIGILLAGSNDEGLEALVGDQEVFEIVRGNVTPDSLKSLIDNATRQARLIALAESANDTTASPDEPITEHIVMETSENGSTIISDGTGQVPTLNPAKISAAADVGAGAVDVLVLTQDEEFLGTIKESARGLHNVVYASTVSQADEAIRNHKIGVAVVDAALVGSNVEKLTMHLRASSPRLVAIVAGRRDDGEMLMDLINRGKVYRFLLKPVSPGRARLAVEASVKHHLEAPDAAFKMSGQPATPVNTTPPKPAPKPAPKPESKPEPKAKAAPKADKTKPAEKPAAKAKPKPEKVKAKASKPTKKKEAAAAIVPKRDEALSPMDDGLSDAFGGGDESSFTETMTGIVETVTKSLKPKKKKDQQAAKAPQAPQVDTGDSALDIDPLGAASGGSLFSDPKILGIGAVAIIAIAAVGFWLFSGSADDAAVVDSATEQPVAAEPDPARDQPSIIETEVVVPEKIGLEDLLEEARLAADAGDIVTPVGNNAIELYMEAVDVAPDNPVAAAGLQGVVEQAIGMAETALLERRSDDALAAIEGVELADPGNARLPFLRAQLTQMQLREYLDGARAAIREQRFEDAQRSIGAARALDVADTAEIDAVLDELRAALSNQQVEGVLADANARLEAGDLIAPSNDNARYYFELALSQDPDNVAARQGLVVIAGKLALQARAEIDAGNFDDADDLLDSARDIDPTSSELAAATTALTAARERREREIREAAERAAAERAAAERAAAERAAAERAAAERAAAERAAAERAAAERAAAERAAAERAAAERAAAERAAAEKAAEERAAAERAVADRLSVESAAEQAPARSTPRPTQQAAEQPAQQRAQPPAQSARQPVRQPVQQPVQQPAQQPAQQAATQPVNNVVTRQPGAQPAGSGSVSPPDQATAPPPRPVAVATLERTRYVAPKYPRAAQRRGISGWVDVVFTVDYDGTVRDVEVRDSNPGDTFVTAATTAVERWEFEPVIEDGVAVQKRAAVRMMFAIE